ncbi:hypothetical protein L226DRAFT_609026 [Lentinus tigrinus ALCF2SS1-7]|uniref:Uncharacterized protein n=1 Tax=Lentinus tigrinus ALCF2SS1-6 TaxID=1328759 RepID=A0A5C2T031_9APHY|nr:hypothetical protein L227DRAFT_648904 [Lentinus tigrinus ALCF2SS1-6]RPD80057.1 hypothetical protein L226DRAFT_609026 [Lentinus tigrinus ALCF2SS1-7]
MGVTVGIIALVIIIIGGVVLVRLRRVTRPMDTIRFDDPIGGPNPGDSDSGSIAYPVEVHHHQYCHRNFTSDGLCNYAHGTPTHHTPGGHDHVTHVHIDHVFDTSQHS